MRGEQDCVVTAAYMHVCAAMCAAQLEIARGQFLLILFCFIMFTT
jgi:hypothetical protein